MSACLAPALRRKFDPLRHITCTTKLTKALIQKMGSAMPFDDLHGNVNCKCIGVGCREWCFGKAIVAECCERFKRWGVMREGYSDGWIGDDEVRLLIQAAFTYVVRTYAC
jgi:hypothetical protein